MTLSEEKERATSFLKALDSGDVNPIEAGLAENFEFEMMGRLAGVAPVRGKKVFLENLPKTLKAMFPKGLNLKFHTVIADGPHVAIQCESDTTAANGKKYANRYHFYFRFDGDKLAQVREYNDTNHVREVFFS